MRLNNYLNETTLSPEKEARKIIDYLIPALKKKDFSSMLKELNKRGKQYGIEFKGMDIEHSRVLRMRLKDTGYDPIPYIERAITDTNSGKITISLFEDNYDTKIFSKELLSTLSHELIHRIQFAKHPPKNTSHSSIKDYLSDPYETEAWAHNVYLGIKMNNSEYLHDVLKHIVDDKKLLNKFLKKIYFYMKDDKSLQNRLKEYLKQYEEG